MESFLNRYRNITVLLLVIFAQLVLLAMQVKNDQDVRFIRLWAVTAVTPVARVVEWFRGGSVGFVRHYILLHDASTENVKLRDEVGRLRLENNFLKNEVNRADRAKALQVFQSHTPSKMLAANVISLGAGAGSNSKVVFVNRGSAEGVMRGMAVVTPDGIVGKVISAYPTASEVLLITDPEFAAGVISLNSNSRGTLKGQGTPMCKVDYVPFEDKVEAGEWFYTSGDDRVFPRGFAVGVAKVVRPGTPFKEILVEPSGMQHGLEDVLIILESVHQEIPDAPPANQPVYLAPALPQQSPSPAATDPANPGAPSSTNAQPPAGSGTEADKLRSIYKSVGDAQKHTFGEGPPGSKPPDFTKLPATATGTPAAPSAGGTSPNTAAPPRGAPATSGGGAVPAPRPEVQRVPLDTPSSAAPPRVPSAASKATQPGPSTPTTGTPARVQPPGTKSVPVPPAGATSPRVQPPGTKSGVANQSTPAPAPATLPRVQPPGTKSGGANQPAPVTPGRAAGPSNRVAPNTAAISARIQPDGTKAGAANQSGPATPGNNTAPQSPPKSTTPAKGASGGRLPE
jgi:rod shape-determining protein MreC